MVKGSGKSSASSGTRKKHARKAGKDDLVPENLPREKKPKGKEKGKVKEPRKKIYVPPVRPAPAQQDPLDSLGLAHQLPSELLVILRRFSKKDTVTKTKALEELQSAWLDKVDPRDEDRGSVDALATMLPVWLHHVPVLFLHPSRRIRLLAVTAHASLLRIPRLHDQLLFQMQEVASEDLVESVLGGWCMAGRDVDRQVSTVARRAWTAFVSLDPAPDKLVLHGPAMQSLVSFIQRAIFDPPGLYLHLNPIHVPVDITPKKTVRGRVVQASTPPIPARTEDDGYTRQREPVEERETDRNARLRVSGLGSLQWLLDSTTLGGETKLSAILTDTLSNPSLWSGLNHAATCPYTDGESFGFGQPIVRSATWNLLQSLLQRCKPEVKELLPLLSVAVLRSSFVESDAQVRAVMWRPCLTFLKEHPTAWAQETTFQLTENKETDEEEESDEEEPKKVVAVPANVRSTAFQEFLQFLELGCAGSPVQGYPTVIIILSTIPSSVLAQADGSHPITAFFASFWAAIDGRALSSLERVAASSAFLSSLLECITFIMPMPISDVMTSFGDILFHDQELSKTLDDVVQRNAIQLLSIGPDLLLTYLGRCEDHEVTVRLWRSTLSAISANPEFIHTSLPHLVSAAQRSELPDYIKPAEQELDNAVSELFINAVDDRDATAAGLLQRIVRIPNHFLTDSSLGTLLQIVASNVVDESSAFFGGREGNLSRFEVLLDLLSSIFQTKPALFADQAIFSSLMPEIYIMVHMSPTFSRSEAHHDVYVEELLWKSWLAGSSAEVRQAVRTSVQERLGAAIFNISVAPSPRDLLNAVLNEDSPLGLTTSDILPSRSRLDDLLQGIRSDPVHPCLAIPQPLVPPALAFDAEDTVVPVDRDGFSSYARGVTSLLYFFVDNRQAARMQLWMLRHLLVLGIYAEEKIQVPALSNPAFGADIPKDILLDILGRIQQMSTYLLVVPGEPRWHVNVTTLAAGEKSTGSLDTVGEFVVDLVKVAQVDDSYRDSRVLFEVLQHIISDATQEEGDAWMVLARKLEKNSPQTSLAIVHAIARFGPEPPRLDRYRNELAAGIIGVPASKANTDGLLLLRRLAASAPDPDSDVAFLPQLRAVNFMKACEQWLTSDEDIEEDVECEATLVFYYLVPILQTVPGAHWDMIFDVVENNLEVKSHLLLSLVSAGPALTMTFKNSSLNDDETLTVLWRTIRLIEMVHDIATTNKTLQAQWQERRSSILLLARDLIAQEPKTTVYSGPRTACREAVLGLIQNIPSSLMDQETLSKMVHLLSDSSSKIQQMSYGLLRMAAQKRTEHLVIEAGVDSESQIKLDLPQELVALLQQTLDLTATGRKPSPSLFGYLLGWLLVFDLFQNASSKVKSGYGEQLIRSNLISTHFLPIVLHILNVFSVSGPNKAFKLDMWGVDEFYVEGMWGLALMSSRVDLGNAECDPDELLSTRLLAAHLYYRALLTISSLVREWITNCKDKNLMWAVSSYTSAYFSPVIIRNELAQVKSDIASSLSNENLSVTVAQSAREVTARYNIDERTLEMTLKVPSEWPLEKIEVKASKRVGLSEVRWRGLMLGVQQIVWAQNGRIGDAVNLFSRNITLFFEGKVECPICYCIIGLREGDLPRRPCGTCKAKFHSSCLYQWFESSHASSCPLCRSAIM
ncbi:hypothetical protein OF83DRAFT_1284410 [Amylostereum chailletii]|nr:hypothetical protein OF83DRAFT_1284410 [Amylostereum chailletii]